MSQEVEPRKAMVPCCLCGTMIEPNPASMCISCLRTQVDITSSIPRQYTLHWCKNCGRFHHNNVWVTAPPESPELLQMLVKTVRGISKLKLVDASFVWTEPHSRRLKIKLTVQKEVFAVAHGSTTGGAVVQQQLIAEFAMEHLYCPDCHKAQGIHQWSAQVQLRQRGADHKRTLFYIEQQILARRGHANVISMKEVPDGLDFFFGNASHAQRFVELLESLSPCRVTRSKKQIAHDDHSNIFDFKNTWLVEIPPICRDDLVLVPRGGKLGEGGLFLCARVSSVLTFVDPVTARVLEVSGATYWANPFRSLYTAERLKQFTVIDSEPVRTPVSVSPPPSAPKSDKKKKKKGVHEDAPVPAAAAVATEKTEKEKAEKGEKYLVAEATVARCEDFGRDEAMHIVQTHLGRFLHSGDLVDCYDLDSATIDVDDDLSASRFSKRVLRDMPEVVIVRKSKRQLTSTGEVEEKPDKATMKRDRKNEMRRRAGGKKTKQGAPVDELDGLDYDTSELTAEQIEQAERDMEQAREDLLEDLNGGEFVETIVDEEEEEDEDEDDEDLE